MKRFMVALIVLCSLLGLTGPAWSLLLTDGVTSVGERDVLLSAAIQGSAQLPNSGEASEIAWVRSVLEDNTVILGETYNVYGSNWNPVQNESGTVLSGVYAINLQYAPEYFLVKIGAGASMYQATHFLYENQASLNWGVVDLRSFGLSLENITAISHVGEYNPTASVPEPGTLLLLGFGLIGLAAGSRRFRK